MRVNFWRGEASCRGTSRAVVLNGRYKGRVPEGKKNEGGGCQREIAGKEKGEFSKASSGPTGDLLETSSYESQTI